MVVNVSILVFVIIAGAVMSKPENWKIPANKVKYATRYILENTKIWKLIISVTIEQ